MFADYSIDLSPDETFGKGHRMVSPQLAGGTLLDMGIYSLAWIFQTLYTTQSAQAHAKYPPPRVVFSVQKYGPTGVDEMASMQIIDEVRRQNGLVYPKEIEATN
ncbi:hypothetical protein BDV06DRAFT_224332 [Aspergillus oleicola]